MLMTVLTNMIILLDSQNSDANAVLPFFQRIRIGGGKGPASSSASGVAGNDLYAITPEVDASVGRGLIAARRQLLKSELCLLRLLPVSKKVFYVSYKQR
jgi:hypothetical protein